MEIDNHAMNNPSEISNRRLNELISIKKPRISYLARYMFKASQLSYTRYCDSIGSPRRPGVNGNIFAERTKRLETIVRRFIYSFDMEEMMDYSIIVHQQILTMRMLKIMWIWGYLIL